MKRGYKQRFSVREMVIVSAIYELKKAAAESISLEDAIAALGKKGLLPRKHIRQSVMVTMNGLCPKLNSGGIYIQKRRIVGRGKKAFWYLSKEAEFNDQNGNSQTPS